MEEEKEFASLNEGEERKAETSQDEGKTETQKNRMEGRSEAKAGGDTKDRETEELHFHSLSIHTLSAGCCELTGMGGKQRASSSSGWCQRIIPHRRCEQLSSRRDRPCAENQRVPTANEP